MPKIYILLSQTGTIPSKMLKIYTHAEFNHVSISMGFGLDEMYSFGRRYLRFPYPGGFVAEGKNRGIFARYPNTQIALLELEVAQDKFLLLRDRLAEMNAQRKLYRYNFKGVFFASIGVVYHKENRYYCSEFVRDILVDCGIAEAKDFPKIVMPVHFLRLPGIREVYRGKLCQFTALK